MQKIKSISKKHHILHIKTNCKKTGFKSKKDAKKSIKNHSQSSKCLRSYLCNHCDHWHITHSTEEKNEQKKKDFALMRLLECDLFGDSSRVF